MAQRIEVGFLPEFIDPAGDAILRRMRADFGIGAAASVRVLDVYTIDADLSEAELARAGAELLCDPISQCFSSNKPLFLPPTFSIAIAVSFRPGVKDNVGGTAREAIEELLGKKLTGAVYTSKHYLISGKVAKTGRRARGARLAGKRAHPTLRGENRAGIRHSRVLLSACARGWYRRGQGG